MFIMYLIELKKKKSLSKKEKNIKTRIFLSVQL